MHPKNIKTIVSLVVVAIFLTAVFAGSVSQKSRAALPSCGDTVANACTYNPVQGLTWGTVSGATDYEVQIFSLDKKGMPLPAFEFARISKTLSYKIVDGDKLSPGTVYAWKVRGRAGPRLGAFGGWAYFKTATPAQKTTESPMLYAADASGNLYEFMTKNNTWVKVSSAPTASNFTFYASTDKGDSYVYDSAKLQWNLAFRKSPVPAVGADLVAPARKGVVPAVVAGITKTFDAVGNIASKVIGRIAGFFSGILGVGVGGPTTLSTDYTLNVQITGNAGTVEGFVFNSQSQSQTQIIGCEKPSSGPNQGYNSYTCTANNVVKGDQIVLFSSNTAQSPGWQSTNLNSSWKGPGSCGATGAFCTFSVPTSAANVQNINVIVHLSSAPAPTPVVRFVGVQSQAGRIKTTQPDSFNRLLDCDGVSYLNCALAFINPVTSQIPLQLTSSSPAYWIWLSVPQTQQPFVTNINTFATPPSTPAVNSTTGLLEDVSATPAVPMPPISSLSLGIGGSSPWRAYAIIVAPPSQLGQRTGGVNEIRQRLLDRASTQRMSVQ